MTAQGHGMVPTIGPWLGQSKGTSTQLGCVPAGTAQRVGTLVVRTS